MRLYRYTWLAEGCELWATLSVPWGEMGLGALGSLQF
jgi:hypothetical protein